MDYSDNIIETPTGKAVNFIPNQTYAVTPHAELK